MGHGTWSDQSRRLDQRRRRRERGAGLGATLRGYFMTVVAGVLIFGVMLLVSPATRPTGVMILFGGAVLYVITRRKKA